MAAIAPPPPTTESTWREHEACTWDWREGADKAQCIEHAAVFTLPTEDEAWSL